MKNFDYIPVVLSSDHNFVMPTYVALSSLLASSNHHFHIHILQSSDVTDADRSVLNSLFKNKESKLSFITVKSNDIDNSFVIRGISTPTYYRLLIPWLLPDYDKVIYIDGDIICTGDLADMYYEKLEDCYIGGVFAVGNDYKDHRKTVGCKDYLNAGVLLINCKLQRDNKLYDVYKTHLSKKYIFQDQDILNIVCQNRMKSLPLKYNFKPKSDTVLPTDTVLIHYAGEKPWNVIIPLWQYWWKYFAVSPFYDDAIIGEIINRTLFKQYTIKEFASLFMKQHMKWLYNLRH